ncbi:MAG: efflux transporter outer membrane subunit [Bryobacteraceae bacterium]|jgi:NodT family efflux transporter outer membrane factor (OMF) lipoprotein
MSEAPIKAKVLACIVSVLLSGCAVGPTYHPPKVSLPSAWLGAKEKDQSSIVTGQSADLARWWQQFQDPALTSLVEEALKANLSLALAEASLRQARALRGIASAGLLPSATASGTIQRQSGGLYGVNGGSRNLFQTGFDAAWELDLFGGVRRNVESANANVQAAIENIRDVQVSIAAEVVIDYVQLRGYQQQIVVARNSLKGQQQTLGITRKLYQVGFDSGLDIATAESTLATTESQIPVLEANARQSIYALSVLLARHPGDLVERLSSTGDLPAIPEEISAGLPSDLLRRRPDIRQAEAQLHSATAQIGVAVAQLFPQFSLTSGGSFQNSLSRSLFLGPAVTWPIFQGGAIVSNIHAQEALRDQAFITYQQTVLTALQDVENALIAFAEEQKHDKSLRDAVAADRTAVDLSLRLFQEGQTNFLSVLTAQGTLYTDESALTQSRENLAADLIALYKALGGGWEENSYNPAAPRAK